MPGTLVVTTLSDGTNSTSATNSILGSAKMLARTSWNGTTLTTNSSYNLSSITRTAAGSYTVVFTNALNNANYVTSGLAIYSNAYPAADLFEDSRLGTRSTTTWYLGGVNATGTAQTDALGMAFAAF